MSSIRKSLRAVIVGAASLRGKELAEVMEDRYPEAVITLLDEDIAAGTLTDAGGEPAVIQGVDPESFKGAQFVFFAGKPGFAAKHVAAAIRDAEYVIDLSGGLRGRSDFQTWIPSLDSVLPPPVNPLKGGKGYHSPSAPVFVSCAFAAGLKDFLPVSASIVFLQPVSEHGMEGIQELEKQTIGLLTFQPVPQDVFGTQVAFNLMGVQDGAMKERFGDLQSGMARDVATYLSGKVVVPALQLVQAPVFHSTAFSAYAEFKEPVEANSLETQLAAAGFEFPQRGEPSPTAIAAAGASRPLLARAERDGNRPAGYWFWGSADNLRLTTANAVAIAERILNS
jgi:aspartate-semialdehyde dehydrogenase